MEKVLEPYEIYENLEKVVKLIRTPIFYINEQPAKRLEQAKKWLTMSHKWNSAVFQDEKNFFRNSRMICPKSKVWI